VFEHLTAEMDGPVTTVTMHRPPVNAVNQAMYGEIRELFGRADELLSGAKVVILVGDGRHFCAGNDLDEFVTMTPQNAPGRMKLVREAFWAIYDCPVPIIAAVHGSALGTGVAIAASCDFMICSHSARLGVPEVGVGVMGGAKHLSRLLPQPLVRLMYYTAEPVPATEFVRFGAAVDAVPDDELRPSAVALAKRISRHSGAALRHAKESLNTIEFMDLKPGYEFEQRLTAKLSAHPDAKEGLRAVIERRAPAYEGEPLPTADRM
jgi:enoyl-CoA hydratase